MSKQNFFQNVVNCLINVNINLEKLLVKQKSTNLHYFYGNIGSFLIWFKEYERESHICNYRSVLYP